MLPALALAEARTLFDLSDAEFAARLETVRSALYLLFNEGYHGSSSHGVVRAELCQEALRLAELLRDFAPANTPTTRALAALMYLHAARLPARISDLMVSILHALDIEDSTFGNPAYCKGPLSGM